MESWHIFSNANQEMVIRLVIAAFLGAVIGYERMHARKAAGIRTHLLVAMGATLFTVISIWGFAGNADPSRIAAGVVVGIGFLGAGTILRQGKMVEGLTTAAGIWAVSAIGVAIGAGLYVVGAVAAVIVPLTLRFLPHHHPDTDQ
jgi:putative Mg2+ transporter-C (MgtC) family protein